MCSIIVTFDIKMQKLIFHSKNYRLLTQAIMGIDILYPSDAIALILITRKWLRAFQSTLKRPEHVRKIIFNKKIIGKKRTTTSFETDKLHLSINWKWAFILSTPNFLHKGLTGSRLIIWFRTNYAGNSLGNLIYRKNLVNWLRPDLGYIFKKILINLRSYQLNWPNL